MNVSYLSIPPHTRIHAMLFKWRFESETMRSTWIDVRAPKYMNKIQPSIIDALWHGFLMLGKYFLLPP